MIIHKSATYIGTMLFRDAIFKYQNVSAGFGFGFGINIRRSWVEYGEPGIKTRFLKDWGAVERIIGPYSEIEIAFSTKYRKQFIINIVPAYPVLFFISTGIRINI